MARSKKTSSKVLPMLLLGCVAVTCLIADAGATESKDKDKAEVGTVIGIDLGKIEWLFG